jgi:hypothetical protein
MSQHPKVEVMATTGAGDRLKVTVPAVAAGEHQLKITTSAGAQALTPGGTDHLAISVT